jgi:DNA-binding NtrC family response regulator
MKTSPLEGVVKPNTQSAAVKETNTVWTVASSLWREYDGLELLKKIRNQYYDLPVILCTAYDTYKYDQRSMDADYYVLKSFDLCELKKIVKRAVEEHKAGHLSGS